MTNEWVLKGSFATNPNGLTGPYVYCRQCNFIVKELKYGMPNLNEVVVLATRHWEDEHAIEDEVAVSWAQGSGYHSCHVRHAKTGVVLVLESKTEVKDCAEFKARAIKLLAKAIKEEK